MKELLDKLAKEFGKMVDLYSEREMIYPSSLERLIRILEMLVRIDSQINARELDNYLPIDLTRLDQETE